MNRGINQVPAAEVKSKRLNYFIYSFSLRQAAPEQEGSFQFSDLFPDFLGAQSLHHSKKV